MNRQEFIRELRRAMSGSFPAGEIDRTAAYYEDYLDMRLKKGDSEEKILRELGDPRLLAKSMKAASGSGAGGRAAFGTGAGAGTGGRAAFGTGAGAGAGGRKASGAGKDPWRADEGEACGGRRRLTRIPLWLVWILLLLIVLAVITLVFRLLAAALPIILIAAGIIALYRFFVQK